MIKVLIMSKQVNTCKQILNQSINKIDDLHLIGIVNSLKEANYIMKKIEPDLIITTEFSIISLLKKYFTTYYPAIILISNSKQFSNSYNNLLLLSPDLSYSDLSETINDYLKRSIVFSYREKIIKTLMKLKFNFNLCGTLYILESVLYVHSYKGSYSFEKLKRDIYSYVAQIYGTNIDRVKWSIARAINYMYDNHTKESYKIVEEYFGTPYPSKPTPKLVISLVASKISI